MKRYIKAETVVGSHMGTKDLFRIGTLADFRQYVQDYDTDDFMKYSEAVRYDLNEVRKFLAIRDRYTYTEEYTSGDWYEIDVGKGHHTKYGTNFVYVDPVRKLWRTRRSAGEFYGDHHPEFHIEDWT